MASENTQPPKSACIKASRKEELQASPHVFQIADFLLSGPT